MAKKTNKPKFTVVLYDGTPIVEQNITIQITGTPSLLRKLTDSIGYDGDADLDALEAQLNKELKGYIPDSDGDDL